MATSKREPKRLTDSVIRQLRPPATGNRIYYDGGNDRVRGFGVRVTSDGYRAFVLNYMTRAGRERRFTIGAYGDWTATDARVEAQRLRHFIDQGGDPLATIEAERMAPTMAVLCDRFEAEHVVRKRESTAADYRRMLANLIRPHFGRHVKVADVRFEDVDALHRKITKAGNPYAANRCVAMLSKMFSLAVRWHMRPDNPAKGIERNVEIQRRRYLSAAELVRLTKALAEHKDRQTANVIRILLLTGCRRGEALAMRWGDLDLTIGAWSKPASSTKQKEPHEVPLSGPARQLLREIADQYIGSLPEYVFPGNGDTGHVVEIKKAWRSICRIAGISGLRLHDLRHSFASQLASGGASLPLIGALLGHSQPSTTARYSHLFQDPQRAAVEKVGAIITAAGKPAAEPTPLKRRGRR
jgi:integrase